MPPPIEIKEGSEDIFTSNCSLIVDPVNCVGVQGKGLALQFKKKYPEDDKAYIEACRNNSLRIGNPVVWYENAQRPVIWFPTKWHYSEKSTLHGVSLGVAKLLASMRSSKWPRHLDSVAFPALGCGLGGLKWDDVHDILVENLQTAPSWMRFELYQPPPCHPPTSCTGEKSKP